VVKATTPTCSKLKHQHGTEPAPPNRDTLRLTAFDASGLFARGSAAKP
jgi:hypothetical protein